MLGVRLADDAQRKLLQVPQLRRHERVQLAEGVGCHGGPRLAVSSVSATTRGRDQPTGRKCGEYARFRHSAKMVDRKRLDEHWRIPVVTAHQHEPPLDFQPAEVASLYLMTSNTREVALRPIRSLPIIAVVVLAPFRTLHAEQAAVLPSASGTLNVVIGNKNGFVIAADSRTSFSQPNAPPIEGQKLFRTGPRSAMVIAGFASIPAGPLQYEIAAHITTRFDGNESDDDAADWVRSVLGHNLTRLASIVSMYEYRRDFSFVATLAGLDEHGPPSITVLDLAPKWKPVGLRGQVFPVVASETEPSTIKCDFFRAVTIGMDQIARRILRGSDPTTDKRVHNYLCRLNADTLDEMSVPEMKELTSAIFAETMKDPLMSRTVGGRVQMGVFPQKGEPEWIQQTFPKRDPLLDKTSLIIGARLTPGKNGKAEMKKIGYMSSVGEFGGMRLTARPGKPGVFLPDQYLQRVFVDSLFDRVQFVLGTDIYVGDLFRNSTLLVLGPRPTIFELNRCVDSQLWIGTPGGTLVRAKLSETCVPVPPQQ